MTKNTIEVVPYDPNWPALFTAEAKRIKEALGSNCIAIHHIGSTSIPGMSAKPIIDILPVVKDIREVDRANVAMERLGYQARGEYGMAFRRFFQKGGDIWTHNVHVYEEGDPEIARYLAFRDWMCSHEEDARNYEKLKLELAAKFPEDRFKYSFGKDAFVASVDAKDGYDGWRLVQALTDREWTQVNALRQKYFFKGKEDPYTWTFTHKDHIHFVFYKNADIIGYVHLQLLPEKNAILRIIVIDENYRNLGWGSHVLSLCERWLYHQGYKNLFLHSRHDVAPYYRVNGYLEMSFVDPAIPEVDPGDIAMGKVLKDRKRRPDVSDRRI